MTRQLLLGSLVGATVMMTLAYPEAEQNGVRARTASTAKPYVPPKTPWGDPDIQGGYSNKDESGVPFERPGNMAGRQLADVDDSELADIVRERQQRAAARVNGPYVPLFAGDSAQERAPQAGQTQVTAAIVREALQRAELYAARPAGYKVPRLANGRPDLQGNWSLATNTPFERARQHTRLVLTREEAVQAIANHPQNVRQATDDNQSLTDGLPTGDDLAGGRGYNSFWIDPGTSYAVVKGEWRSSWITYPENGRIPGLTAKAEAARAATPRRQGSGVDNPEERSLTERCIVMPTAGPPFGTYLYNNNVSIVQTDDHVMIMAEMIHDVRIVRLNAKHRNDGVQPWMGDSIGRWEGDTLVVETVAINPAQRGGRRLSDDAVITERFTRWNDHQILYQFEVKDPATYTDVWRGEIALNQEDERVFEYACHESNYGLAGILAGGRQAEGTLSERMSKAAANEK